MYILYYVIIMMTVTWLGPISAALFVWTSGDPCELACLLRSRGAHLQDFGPVRESVCSGCAACCLGHFCRLMS